MVAKRSERLKLIDDILRNERRVQKYNSAINALADIGEAEADLCIAVLREVVVQAEFDRDSARRKLGE